MNAPAPRSQTRVVAPATRGAVPFRGQRPAPLGADVLCIGRPDAPSDILARGKSYRVFDRKDEANRKPAIESVSHAEILFLGVRLGATERSGRGPDVPYAKATRLSYAGSSPNAPVDVVGDFGDSAFYAARGATEPQFWFLFARKLGLVSELCQSNDHRSEVQQPWKRRFGRVRQKNGLRCACPVRPKAKSSYSAYLAARETPITRDNLFPAFRVVAPLFTDPAAIQGVPARPATVGRQLSKLGTKQSHALASPKGRTQEPMS